MELAKWKTPPKGYGEVAFFWWQGDKITREKLGYILEQLKDARISGLQINYAHGDTGGRLWGLTMESSPRPFSEAWWETVGWFLDACRPYGIALSLSDYTLASPGQGFFTDDILHAHPEFIGQRLVYENGEVKVETVPWSANPMAIGYGDEVVRRFYGEFERRFPGECGKGINYFFSDELNFNITGNLWCDDFAEQFAARKGYDIMPLREAIFTDIGPQTPKIRLDYYDVIVQLEEERYFRPVGQWHRERGMLFGCDHGGRGKELTEFGDYFRTAKWYNAPGNDQPHLECDVIKNKVNSSVAHVNGLSRVWLEGFYGSGWGTSSGEVADAVIRNYLTGSNLLSLHGLYYAMDASSWEWAPPCNHYHMPYWTEMKDLLAGTERLSWLLSQGHHVCTAAVYYPVAAAEADAEDGKRAAQEAFAAGESLYRGGIDFDFVDFTALECAEIENGNLRIGREQYAALVIPGMKTVRFAAWKRICEFAEQGGTVIRLGELPTASDRIGRKDPVLEQLNEQLRKCAYNDMRMIDKRIPRDMTAGEWHLHRRIDGDEIFCFYGAEEGTVCRLHALGHAAFLDWKSGKAFTVEAKTVGEYTEVQARQGLNIIVISPHELPTEPTRSPRRVLTAEGEWACKIIPTLDNTFGDYAYPASREMLGPEIREVRALVTEEDCSGACDDTAWPVYGWGEGRYFTCNGKPYCYSLRRGNLRDPGPQHSYHGLKGYVGDDVMTMGEQTVTMVGSDRAYAGDGPYVWESTFVAEHDVTLTVDGGALYPDTVEVDGETVSGNSLTVTKGRHRVRLTYTRAGRTHFMLTKGPMPPHDRHTTGWLDNPNSVVWDAYPEDEGKTCWVRFVAPPGTKEILTDGFEQAYADGEALPRTPNGFSCNGEKPMQITMKKHLHAGSEAILSAPIRFRLGQGKIMAGDWSHGCGLDWYSGGILYRRTVRLHAGEATVLDLGKVVSSARVFCNGKPVATLTSAPFTADLTDYIREGENELEVLVHNTLANQMLSSPSVYIGDPTSGMSIK